MSAGGCVRPSLIPSDETLTLLVRMKNGTAIWGNIERLNIKLSHNPETPFLNTYLREIKTYFYITLVHRCS